MSKHEEVTVVDLAGGPAAPLRHDDALVQKVRRAALAIQRKDWEQGVVAQAFMEAGDDDIAVQMARASLIYARPDGRLASLGSEGLIDCGMLGEPLRRAAQLTADPALDAADRRLREYLLRHAPRAGDGTMYHTGRQMWVDSFNCAAPYLAICEHYGEAIQQIEGLRGRLWNAEKRLFSHIWDEGEQRFANEAFWGVGNGWAAVGLSRVIRVLPGDHQAEKNRLTGYLEELLDGCLPYRREDGLFHNVVDRADTFVEANLGQMLAYSIYSGIRGGWLSDTMREDGDRMRAGARARVDEHGFVQDVCGAPDFDRSGIAAEAQAFFLLMESAAARLEQPAAV